MSEFVPAPALMQRNIDRRNNDKKIAAQEEMLWCGYLLQRGVQLKPDF